MPKIWVSLALLVLIGKIIKIKIKDVRMMKNVPEPSIP